MNAKTATIVMLSAMLAVFSSGCLVQETVTVNGEVRKEGYVVKRPIADALGNSQ
jgi:outer membrane protein assembly factor BamE (lipoprotein component of BamABCDE complex)